MYKFNSKKLLGLGSIYAKPLWQLKCDIVEVLTNIDPTVQRRLGAKQIGSISWDISLEKAMETALGNYISFSLNFLSSQFVQIGTNNRIQKHLDKYGILEESLHRFFKAGHADECMSVSEANTLLVKLISLTENIWLYKKTWSENRKETMA